MIRRVAFSKAILAGAMGAVAWELALRLLIWFGVPAFDLVRLLGTMVLPDAEAWQWWPLGLCLHAAVGAIWAIFYAYFFWSTFAWKPRTQGAVFSIGPAVLAGLVMVPQMGWMSEEVLRGLAPHPGLFAWHLGWGGPLCLVLGHLIYGATMGSLYTHPVGHSTNQRIRITELAAASRRRAPEPEHNGAARAGEFMFATGIECSYPTIENGRWRMDQLFETGHYRYWRRDLELVRELGLRYLRYGPPLHHVWTGPERYDWSFMDEVAKAMRELHIVPIMDLCHFGVPNWIGNFQNPDFAEQFALYASAFARRYPWVRLYTPVNEMYVTAKLSALDGVWNEQLRSERAFVTALKHLTRASILATQAIARERPDAIFVNSESSEFFQPCCPDQKTLDIAEFENERRFISLDLIYAVRSSPRIRRYLFEQGMTDSEYDWFMNQQMADRSILGIDYYEWNEKLINSDGHAQTLGELFGWYVITKQYYDRYRRPLMHTETNCQDAKDGPAWLWRQWHNVQLMRSSGIPVVGFTWYSLIDQVDWNIGLSRSLGNVNPVGLFDLYRDPRPVAQAYLQLVHLFNSESLVTNADVKDLDAVLDSARSPRPLPGSGQRMTEPAGFRNGGCS
jgi:beta-glucosidase/6-phospho-beta-glucosidase/beta-galactosidase